MKTFFPQNFAAAFDVHLDANVGRIYAVPTAHHLHSQSSCVLTHTITGSRQLHSGPSELHSGFGIQEFTLVFDFSCVALKSFKSNFIKNITPGLETSISAKLKKQPSENR